jgi:hypothetical protein
VQWASSGIVLSIGTRTSTGEVGVAGVNRAAERQHQILSPGAH